MSQHKALLRVCTWPPRRAGIASAPDDTHREVWAGVARKLPGPSCPVVAPLEQTKVPGSAMHRTPATSLGAEAQLSDLRASQKL